MLDRGRACCRTYRSYFAWTCEKIVGPEVVSKDLIRLVVRVFIIAILAGSLWSCTDLGPEVKPTKREDISPMDTGPSWSPDGEWIAYSHMSIDPSDTVYPSGLYIIDTLGNRKQLIVAGCNLNPSWSPRSDRIAFSSCGLTIMTVTPNGFGLHQVTTNIDGAFFPSWSPDGLRIAFSTRHQDTRRARAIWIVNADGSQLRDISEHGTGEWLYPSWSPDGTMLAHSRYLSLGTQEIYTMDSAGRSATRLTTNAVDDDRPSWSHDGKTIAWTQSESGGGGVWTMDVDGRNKRRLVNGMSASWSPDSRRLVHSRPTADNSRLVLWIIQSDGTDVRQLTF